MTPMQQMFLGLGAATKTYVDDLFYTHVYKGDGNVSGQNITGSDFEPDLVWIKGRNHAANHILVDSVRGNNKVLYSNTNDDQDTNEDYVNSRFEGGFKVGNSGITNGSNETNVGWTWKKTPGFFDIVQYSGSGSAKTVAHSLGSIPGCIWIKRTDTTSDWRVYHRDTRPVTPEETSIRLNTNDAKQNGAVYFNDTFPSSSVFTVGTDASVNASGGTYIAYIFAGGESTAATARSIKDFDGSRYIETDTQDSDFAFGTGDFTVEGWYKFNHDNQTEGLFSISSGGNADLGSNASRAIAVIYDEDKFRMYAGNVNGGSYVDSATYKVTEGIWYHVAYVRNSGTTSLYVNGEKLCSIADTVNWAGVKKVLICGASYNFYYFDGEISNFRVVKGTAVYTSSFKRPTEPLTNITNTVLLCCNNSSTTGSTVIPSGVGITGNTSNVTASTNSPFDDPAAFVFGEGGDQPVIACGTYTGNGSSTGPEVFLGWEPQYWIVKRTDAAANWQQLDSMRGWFVGSNDEYLAPNNNSAESDYGFGHPTSTGFVLDNSHAAQNASNGHYVYIAIRRPDGYVGKPPELGTSVLGIALGGGGSAEPTYTSNFPVDFAVQRDYNDSSNARDWEAGARLLGKKFIEFNTTNAESSSWPASAFDWDYNNGWAMTTAGTGYISYMWKRHAGFDVVAGLEENNSHNLGKPVEMIWVKRRDNTSDWFCWHKGLNGGGSNAVNYHVRLNTTAAESSISSLCPIGDTLPTATHFKTGSDSDIRNAGSIAFLFASVDGISKVGSYTGSSSTVTVTTGFQPRFVIIRRVEATDEWVLLDTLRGWGSGNDAFLHPNTSGAQNSNMDLGAPTSTGFTVTTTYNTINTNGENFIYYAHA